MWIAVVALLVGLFSFFYFWNTRNYGMFSKHGIYEPRKTFPFGSDCNWDVMTGKKHFFRALDETYSKHKKHVYLGTFFNSRPVLIITDLEVVKRILIKDFSHFEMRNVFDLDLSTEANKIVGNMMSLLPTEKWKKVRSMLSPAFTSGKLKSMNPLINKVGAELTNHLGCLASKNEEFAARDVLTKYALDCISTCAFGIETNSFNEPNGIFSTKVRKLESTSKLQVLRLVMARMTPKIMKLLKWSLFDEEAVLFLASVVRNAIQRRKETQTRRGDLIDLILDAVKENADEASKAREDDQFEKDAEITTDDRLSSEEMEVALVSSSILFYITGFDTSAASVGMTMAYLAKYPNVQEKLYQEIKDTFETHGTQDLDYYVVQNMPYLEMVFKEVLRFYFSGMLERVCTKDYQLPDSSFVVPKGMHVQIPSSCIHREARYFPDPNNFNPDDNWSAKAKAARPPYSFLAFGQGPLNCVGMRFALIVSKIALIRIIGNFEVSEGPQMPKEFIQVAEGGGVPDGGIWCKVKRRSDEA